MGITSLYISLLCLLCTVFTANNLARERRLVQISKQNLIYPTNQAAFQAAFQSIPPSQTALVPDKIRLQQKSQISKRE
ncbi:hypothetical protein C9J01_06655 [Photobacterium rosenbergii]|uniref:Uncharacterized protein n=1 Tax=Photobacterium rosenbergii TaxID=294936 RepID=A0A2T3NME9_9GAMM|nr:hypothetical protein C9J01_06655 [Photobacterium rosenbergii]